MSKQDSENINNSIEENRLYHTRYLRAISNPLRRSILKVLKKGYATFEELQSNTGLDGKTLKWHLSILEHGSCVEKEIKQGKLIYKLTQEGRVIDFLK